MPTLYIYIHTYIIVLRRKCLLYMSLIIDTVIIVLRRWAVILLEAVPLFAELVLLILEWHVHQ